MASEIVLRRSGDRLIPVTEWDRENLLEYPEGRDLTVRISRTRSAKQHRLFWALMQKTVDNHPYYLRPEQLVEWLKIRLGYVEEIMFHDGKIMTKVSSISFAAMGQDQFRKFFDLAVHIIVTEVLTGIHEDDLLREIEAMLGEKIE